MDKPLNSIAKEIKGPPYMPRVASIGGIPTVKVDVPICAVFLFLYVCAAVGHMTIFQLNRRRGHKFIMSGLLFGFCMARIVTQIMRIAWACKPTNVRVVIAAMVFVAAGVLILFLINLVFAQRILRAAHPHIGWHKAIHYGFLVMYVLIVLTLVMVVTVTVQSFYSLNLNTHRIDADVQHAATVYFMAISFLPIPTVILTLIFPRKTRIENFGSGRWRTKIWILLTSSVLLCLGASFRCGTSFKNPRPLNNPAWYHARWCFYFFDFTTEIIVVYLYLIFRVDKRFHIPDKSHGPGDYTRGIDEKIHEDDEQPPNPRRTLLEEEVSEYQVPAERGRHDEETGMMSEESTLHSPVSGHAPKNELSG